MGIDPKIVRLPNNMDPDEYILKNGKSSFDEIINNPLNIMEYKEMLLKRNINLNNTKELADYTNTMIKEISKIEGAAHNLDLITYMGCDPADILNMDQATLESFKTNFLSILGDTYAENEEMMKALQETAGQGKSGRAIRRLFKESLQYKQELRRYGHIPCLPEKWLCKEDLKCILVTFWLSQNKGGSYEQMICDVKKYNNLLYAITVTANGYLVDGFNANLVATLYDLPIKVVKLDNVIFLGFPSGGE